MPKTLAGFLAYIEHLGDGMGFQNVGPHGEDIDALIATFRAFAATRQ